MRPPQTTDEFCLSAGETLPRWYLEDAASPDLPQDPQWVDAAYLIASALHAVTVENGLVGDGVRAVRLGDVLTQVRGHAVSALQEFPGGSFASLGAELLARYNSDEFDRTAELAADVLRRHLEDAADPACTLGGRAEAFTVMLRSQASRAVEQALEWEDY